MTEDLPIPRQRRLPKLLRIVVPLLLLAAIGWGVSRQVWRQTPEPGLHLSGRIEGYETDVGAKVGGKI